MSTSEQVEEFGLGNHSIRKPHGNRFPTHLLRGRAARNCYHLFVLVLASAAAAPPRRLQKGQDAETPTHLLLLVSRARRRNHRCLGCRLPDCRRDYRETKRTRGKRHHERNENHADVPPPRRVARGGGGGTTSPADPGTPLPI